MADSIVGSLTLMDNIFMQRFFDRKPRLAEVVLRAVLGEPGLELVSALTEKTVSSYRNRSVGFDVFCADGEGDRYDLEFQDDVSKAPPERAQFYGSMLASEALPKGADFRDLPRTTVVFVTNGDALGLGLPVYDSVWTVRQTGEPLNDRQRIVYVDATYNGYGDTELGRVMHDVTCPDPDEMLNPVLARAARELKETMEGDEMEMQFYSRKIRDEAFSEGMEKGIEQGLERGLEQGIERGEERGRASAIGKLVRDGALPLDKISQLFGITPAEAESYAKMAG